MLVFEEIIQVGKLAGVACGRRETENWANSPEFIDFYDNDKKLSTELSDYLKSKKVEKVDCVGLATEYCVKFTAIDSIREGFYTRVISKCTKGLIDEDIKNSLDEMRSLGIIII